MKKKKPTVKQYHKGVGLLLGLLLPGSAHYLSGKRIVGLAWLFGLFISGFAALVFIATPGTFRYICGMTAGGATIVLWLIMLKQSCRPIRRIGFFGWLVVISFYPILVSSEYWVIKQSILSFYIPFESMAPTILPGDRLLVERISYKFSTPQRGDVVVFFTNDSTNETVHAESFYVKRVVGLPGETIQIQPPYLLINGEKVDSPLVLRKISEKSRNYKGFQLAYNSTEFKSVLVTTNDAITLDENEYFVTGDNSLNSIDSRFYGPISGDYIIGKATRIFHPLNRINKLR